MAQRRIEGTRAPNGAASIYLGADGRWHGRVSMGVRDDGRPDRRHVRGATESEVIKKVRALEKARDGGTARKAGRAWTVEKWLTHWLETIAQPAVRRATYDYYAGAVSRYLIPGLGAHRVDRLEPEHIEKLYARLRGAGTGGATMQRLHRTLRAALNEAVRRGHTGRNPLAHIKTPTYVSEEIDPFTVDEARSVMQATRGRRNGVRFLIALTLGLRKGEALGLQWSDLDEATGRLTIRRALQRQSWRHGCQDKPCGRKRAAECPSRHGGGLVVVPPKSRAGRRTVDVPPPLLLALAQHRQEQAVEREVAADLWQEGGWMFAQPTGKPIDPRADHDSWKELLTAARVRDARLHDARHTAATMLLVLNVPTRAVMDLMGWSQASMAGRYQHVPDALRREVAARLGNLLWSGPEDGEEGPPGVLVPTWKAAESTP